MNNNRKTEKDFLEKRVPVWVGISIWVFVAIVAYKFFTILKAGGF